MFGILVGDVLCLMNMSVHCRYRLVARVVVLLVGVEMVVAIVGSVPDILCWLLRFVFRLSCISVHRVCHILTRISFDSLCISTAAGLVFLYEVECFSKDVSSRGISPCRIAVFIQLESGL